MPRDRGLSERERQLNERNDGSPYSVKEGIARMSENVSEVASADFVEEKGKMESDDRLNL